MTGTTISHFKVLEKIGAGGMGEVYLAEDTKLDRQVALKVLPPHALASEDDRARFYREARAAAALNHANIGHVYEIDEATLESGETRPFIAMEYVDGESLAERIGRGPLPLQDVIAIGSQIASGLAAAHAKNIVHRDIKPGNVMLTKAGEAKILDFGLAKTAASTKLTRMGSTLGTFAYMSPEQARGEEVDARTDVWSLGAVLYEMITGRMPFPGEYEQAVVYGILNEEPEPPTALRTGVPMELERIVTKCLSKDRRQRYQHVDEVGVDLGAVDVAVTRIHQSASHVQRRDPRRNRRVTSPMLSIFAGVVIGASLVGVLWMNYGNPESTDSRKAEVTRLNLVLSDDSPLAPVSRPWYGTSQPLLALSPDASTLIYVSKDRQLVVRRLESFASTTVEGTDGATFPFFSPDGEWVGFFAEGELKKVRVSGGGPVTLCDASAPNGGVWSQDGRIFFATQEGFALHVVDADGGEPRLLTESSEDASSYSWPQLLPGNRLVVTDWIGGGVVVLSSETGSVLSRIGRASTAMYTPSGHVLFTEGGQLMAAALDADDLDLGSAVPVLNWGGSTTGPYTLSTNGTLVYDPRPAGTRSELVWVDRMGEAYASASAFEPQVFGTFRVSLDGLRAAVRVFDESWDIWVYDFEKGLRRKLTRQGNNHYPLWTPDQKWITYASADEGKWSIYRRPASGLGDRELLLASESRIAPFSWSPDGRILAFYDHRGVSMLSLQSDTTQSGFAEGSHVAFSPDGKFVAYQSVDGGLYAERFPKTDERWLISSTEGEFHDSTFGIGDESPRWSGDGRELFYRAGQRWYVVDIEYFPAFRAGSPQFLFEGDYLNMSGLAFDIDPAGDRLLVLRPADEGIPHRHLNVITNWFSELDRLVPTGRK